MYLPRKNLDNSARFERALAEQLRQEIPTFAPNAVDLSGFRPLRAKIDCITIARPPRLSVAAFAELKAALKGKVARRNDDPKAATIHDPTLDDLRWLSTNRGGDRVEYIEIAVDARLPAGTNDIYLLRKLKEEMRHCVAPQRHRLFDDKAVREYWDLGTRKHVHDAVAKAAPLTTVWYCSPRRLVRLKLYIKTMDQGVPMIGQPFLRIELSMDIPSWAGIDRIGDMKSFGKRLRTFCSPAFFMGSDFKGSLDDGAMWKTRGAAWDLRKQKHLVITPNAVVNRAFGDALNELGQQMQRI